MPKTNALPAIIVLWHNHLYNVNYLERGLRLCEIYNVDGVQSIVSITRYTHMKYRVYSYCTLAYFAEIYSVAI